MSRRSLVYKVDGKWVRTYNVDSIPLKSICRIRRDGHEAPFDITKRRRLLLC